LTDPNPAGPTREFGTTHGLRTIKKRITDAVSIPNRTRLNLDIMLRMFRLGRMSAKLT
jgi:hypothetical protein